MKKVRIDQRKVGIVLGFLLGTFVALYLGGLAGQLNTNYQEWAANGGMTGEVMIEPISVNPLKAVPYVFSGEGIKGLLFVLIVAGGIFFYIKFHDKFGGKDNDERNFIRSSSGTYGTAGWMSEKESQEVLEITTPGKAQGTILGQKGKSLLCLPEDTRLNKHIAIFGASGTMKSRAIIRNMLFQAMRREESVIVTDPKTELYSDTSEMFRQRGYTVKVFNLVHPDNSDSWNCMDDLKGDTLMAQVLTDVIISNTSEGRGDHFWDNGEANLLKALVLYIDQDNVRGIDAKHLPAVYQLLTQNSERQLTAMFEKLNMNHPARAPYNLFAQASDTVRAGIIIGLGTRLQVLQAEAVRKISSRSDIDLAEPGRSKCAYFIILSDQEGALDFLSSLFFSFLFINLVRYADKRPSGQCKLPVNIILDEGNNVGSIPDFSRRLSTIRSRLISVMFSSQNLPQLQNRYPNNLWAEILGNMDTHLMLGCSDDVTADFFSVRSGDMTVEVNSTMTVRKTIAMAQVIPQYRYTEGKGRRRLLTPDEILRLPHDDLLIVMRGQKLLKAKKFDYIDHPLSKDIVRSTIFDYKPIKRPPQLPIDFQPVHQTELAPNTSHTHVVRIPDSPKYQGSARPPRDF